MLHTHLLSPFHFAQDMSKPPYNTLAGVLDFPLLRLQDKLRHNPTSSETVDDSEWNRRYPGRPYNLIEGFAISGENSYLSRFTGGAYKHKGSIDCIDDSNAVIDAGPARSLTLVLRT
jgi:hypothetical protein